MKLIMLGTGNAVATECYNTCFVIQDEENYFMVDGGGGNTILHQLKEAGINWMEIKNIFITHRHVDHLLGIIWMVRMICQSMKNGEYNGSVNIYGHDEVINIVREMANILLTSKETSFIDKRLNLVVVEDKEKKIINGKEIIFFDINSSKAKQFGFSMLFDKGKKLTCCGDEPYNECEEIYAKNSDWLLHEAFCLSTQTEMFHPYEKHHSTVKDACIKAQLLGVKNLILYHTEDINISNRKKLYTDEGKKYYLGNLYIPDDLTVIEL